MVLAFTGTRKGLSKPQLRAVAAILARLRPERAVHGDAIGADEQFHALWAATLPTAAAPALRPLAKDNFRAHCRPYSRCHPAESPLTRNTKLVADADVLVACPDQPTHQRTAGLWHTIRLAQEKKIPVAVVWPDGEVEEYPGGVPAEGDWMRKEAAP